MSLRVLAFATIMVLPGVILPALSASAAGNPDAGRDLVMRSCATCHLDNASSQASDAAPPLSFMAKDNKDRPAWIRGWLMDPHPPMPGIPLSRRQIDDVIAYLNTLPVR